MFKETQKLQSFSDAIPLESRTSDVYPTIAVIDTGISADLLENASVIPGINLSGEGLENDTNDRNGHGTLVASTILRFAPRAPILPIKLIVDCGYLRLPDRLETSFEWVLEHHISLNIGVICAAFSDSSHSTDDQLHRGTRLQETIAALRKAGVATVAPAGNRYQRNRIWDEQGMAWPAILREVISVGAITHGNELPRLSSRTQRLHSRIGTGCCTTTFALPGEPGGTSGAAAVVAGCLAALKGTYPEKTVDELIKQLMLFHYYVTDDNNLTWPVLDIGANGELGKNYTLSAKT